MAFNYDFSALLGYAECYCEARERQAARQPFEGRRREIYGALIDHEAAVNSPFSTLQNPFAQQVFGLSS
jgi:hypothetical protein